MHSDSGCGSSVDMTAMVPIMDRVCLTPGLGRSVPMGISLEKMLEAGRFTSLDMGPVKESPRQDGSDEHIFR